MNRKSLSLCVALCLSILATAHAALADPGQSMSDRIEQMKLDGWQEVAEGVLQRTMGSKIETFTYGEEGMQWSTDRLKERVARLQHEYSQFPSEELAQTIEALKGQVADRERTAQISQATAADSLGGGETLDACTITYDATADAYGLSGSSAPGTGARAYAKWYSDCGHVGTTFAHAYTRAITANGTLNVQQQDDPDAGLVRSGTNIVSNATASASGVRDCYSEAFAKSENLNLNITYTASDTNYDCPNALQVSISGEPDVYLDNVYQYCYTVRYYSSVSGGTPSYSYAWYLDNAYQGSGTYFDKQYCGQQYPNPRTYEIKLIVNDSGGQSKTALYWTNVYYYYEQTCTGGCCPQNSTSGDESAMVPIEPCY